MPPSTLQKWRSDPDKIDMRWRIFDLNRPKHLSIEKLTLLAPVGNTYGEVVYTTVNGWNTQSSPSHGWWHCTYDTTIDMQFNFRGTEVELQFQTLDNSERFQNLQTSEVILMPWSETPLQGPTVRSLEQNRLRREQ